MNKLIRWWKFDGKYLHIKIWYGIKNLIAWFPIIWIDRNWDQYFIWNILQFKLQRQGNNIKRNGNHVNADHDAKYILLCSKLVQKIRDEEYIIEYMDYSDFDGDIPNFNPYFKKYPLIYKKVLNGEGIFKPDAHSDEVIAMNIGYINHIRVKKLLFKIIESEIDGWSD
jgi:hypothetical protein